jgi:succinate dehydrogenase / fumarate reductase, iron-sulfur subunit
MKEIKITVKRSEKEETYTIPFISKMHVLEALFHIQENVEPDLAFRWNCREGICGSCAAEVNGRPVLMCKTEITPEMENIRIEPLKVFPVIKDLVTDPSEVYDKLAKLKPYFTGEKKNEFRKIYDEEIKEVQDMRKCINCFICYDSCHVIRNHPDLKFTGPMNVLKATAMDKHPYEKNERVPLLKEEGIWNCNVSKCCTTNCPQGIKITDDALIPAKERAIDETNLLKAAVKKLRKGKW